MIETEKIYFVIIEDRHADVQVNAFRAPESAIEFAKTYVEEATDDDADFENFVEEGEGMQQIDRWLFAYEYSCEGDYIHVEEGDLEP